MASLMLCLLQLQQLPLLPPPHPWVVVVLLLVTPLLLPLLPPLLLNCRRCGWQ